MYLVLFRRCFTESPISNITLIEIMLWIRSKPPSGDSHLDFEGVTMALYSLQIHSSGFIQPRSDNLFENLTASLPSDNSASYGIRIKNGTGQPLFFYLFYFDPSTYTIQVCPYRGYRPLKPDPSISQFMNLVLPQCLQSTPSR
jgi:hypothetical protein